MTDLHREHHFESEICDHLASHGWLYSSDDTGYDRERALFPEDLFAWIRDTQPKEWEKLSSSHSRGAEEQFLARLCQVMDRDGSLSVLRHGIRDRNAQIDLCQFRPSHGLNAETEARYRKVRLRVMRQVHYSVSNQNSLDLVLFANGIPVATAELKTDFTQSIDDAVWQYKKDRLPRDPETRKPEPLLEFKRRALVHFAVSTDEVFMTTRLEGRETRFLPFNRGYDQGSGNPPNPEGYRTSYLWERIWERETWLDILENFIHLEKKKIWEKDGGKGIKESLVFPRFHQWEAVTQLVGVSRNDGPGHTYLVQHSAGSGKTNSIAWLSHRLASLHDVGNAKVFDSVIVVTDRRVLDSQLQDAIYQFEHKHGVVCRIDSQYGAKSDQLLKALADNTPIIIVTLQTFPVVLEKIRENATLKGRSFAVIVDEAHSSMGGAAAKKLRAVLTAEQIEEGEEVGSDDVLVVEQTSRKLPANASFYAFTATPKAKTIELFGQRPDPSLPPSDDNKPQPFHVYSMQQAIEEHFILDVLKDYTPYKVAYRIAHNGREYDDREVDKAEGMKQIARWVRLHPYNIAQKVAIIVEHFREKVRPLLSGQAKAMVVTGSRKEAVRYKLAMDRYIRECGYTEISALVAFSGEVTDPDSGPGSFSEISMNPGLHGQDLRDVFDAEDFNVLLVANKYQTGFDQPKLVAMYVDKKLAGVAAVQTLCRLNRTFPGKESTFILDFVNDPEEIRKAFEPYYRTAELSGISDPNIVHDLGDKLDALGIYTQSEIDLFAKVYFDPKGTQKALQGAIAPAVDRYRGKMGEAREKDDALAIDGLKLFVRDLGAYVRAYDFLSQIIDYQETDLEKRYVFFKSLSHLLRSENRKEDLDLSSLVLTHHRIRSRESCNVVLGADGEDKTLHPLSDSGSGQPHTPEKESIARLIEKYNLLFEGELSEADKVAYVEHIKGKLLENDTLAQQAKKNTKEQFALGDYPNVLTETIIAGLDNYNAMGAQILKNGKLKEQLSSLLLDLVYDGLKRK